jgi:hypothetical protein
MKVTARSAGLSVVLYQLMGNDGGLRTKKPRPTTAATTRRKS